MKNTGYEENVRESISIIRNELLKHGDLYDGFHSSILSVLKPKEKYVGDGCFELQLIDFDASMLAEEILKRIIGEE